MPQVVKTVPIDLKPDTTYGIRVRSINAFGAPSDWSPILVADTSPAGLAAAGRLVIGPDGMTGYDNYGQMTFNYLANAVTRTNLLTNPSFESAAVGTTGWVAEANTTISRITTDYFVGQPGLLACLKVQASADGQYIGVRSTISDVTRRVTASPGTYYTASAYVRVPAGQPDSDVRISFAFYTSGGVLISQSDSLSANLVTSSSNWVRITRVGIQAPSGTSFLSVIIRSNTNMSNGSIFYVDGVIVEATAVLRDYFDGSTSKGTSVWSGTVNDSTSTLDNNSIYAVNGGVFTSPTVQTSRTATTTGGVVMNSTGLFGYNTSGAATFTLSATQARLDVDTVQLGKTISSQPGFNGLTLESGNFLNAWIRRDVTLGNTTYFRVGDSSHYIVLDTAGSYNLIWPNFTVDNSGFMTAVSASISGAITGGTIDIGGFDSTSFHVDSSGNMWMGAASYSGSTFRIASTGVVEVGDYASGNGVQLNGSTIYMGANATITNIYGNISMSAGNGLYLYSGTGNTTISANPFTNTGNLYLGAGYYSSFVITASSAISPSTIYISPNANYGGNGIAIGSDGHFHSYSAAIHYDTVFLRTTGSSTGISHSLVINNNTPGLYGAIEAGGLNFGNDWPRSQLVVFDNGASNGQASISFWNQAGLAPILRQLYSNSYGERLDVVNSGNTIYAGFGAAAYNTYSTIRAKDLIEEDDIDEKLLNKVAKSQTRRYKYKQGPTIIRPTERFKDINARWTAKGKTALSLTGKNTRVVDHDCSEDHCDGTPENPCMIMRNFNTGSLGLIAEEHYKDFPEHVSLDKDGIPEMIDISQLSMTTMGALGALVRKMGKMQEHIKALEDKLAK